MAHLIEGIAYVFVLWMGIVSLVVTVLISIIGLTEAFGPSTRRRRRHRR